MREHREVLLRRGLGRVAACHRVGARGGRTSGDDGQARRREGRYRAKRDHRPCSDWPANLHTRPPSVLAALRSDGLRAPSPEPLGERDPLLNATKKDKKVQGVTRWLG